MIVPLGARPDAGTLPGNVFAFTQQREAIDRILADLGEVTFGDISIAPFAVEAHGHTFGMVLSGPDPDDPDDEWYWYVTLEPGDFMAFSAPWDSGEYET